jgi:hypothetical protein
LDAVLVSCFCAAVGRGGSRRYVMNQSTPARRLNDDRPRELQRDPEDGSKIVISTSSLAPSSAAAGGGLKRPRPNNVFGGGEEEDEEDEEEAGKKAKAVGAAAVTGSGAGKKSELERLMEMDAQRKQREEEAAKSKVREGR